MSPNIIPQRRTFGISKTFGTLFHLSLNISKFVQLVEHSVVRGHLGGSGFLSHIDEDIIYIFVVTRQLKVCSTCRTFGSRGLFIVSHEFVDIRYL